MPIAARRLALFVCAFMLAVAGSARAQSVGCEITDLGQRFYDHGYYPGHGPDNAYDGIQRYYSGESAASGTFIGRDFGTTQAVRRIAVRGTARYTFYGDVHYSDNGTTFTSTGATVNVPPGTAAWQTYELPDFGAHRYWVVMDRHDDAYHEIDEMKFFSCPDPIPLIAGVRDDLIAEGSVASMSIAAAGAAAGAALSYAASGLPPGLTLDAATGAISGAVAQGSAGRHAIVASVSDGTQVTSRAFEWVVTQQSACTLADRTSTGSYFYDHGYFTGSGPGNAFDRAPTFYSGASGSGTFVGRDFGAPQAIRQIGAYGTWGYTFYGQVQYSDDGATFTNAGVTINVPASSATWQVYDVPDVGAHRYWIVSDLVDDAYHEIDELRFFSCGSLAIAGPGNLDSTRGSAVSVPIVIDAAGGTVTFGATGLPSGVQVNPATGLISGTIDAMPGSYPVVLSAADGSVTVTRGITWTVRPLALGPSGPLASALPTFTWNAAPSATLYRVFIADASGVRLQGSYSPAQADCASGAGTCAATPGIVLKAGVGRWRVQPVNPSGDGPWSEELSFIVPGMLAGGEVLRDTFTGANGTDLSLHRPDFSPAGAVWTWITSNRGAVLQDGEAALNTTLGAHASWAIDSGLTDDVEVSVDIRTSPTRALGGLVLRAVDAGTNSFLLAAVEDNKIGLSRVVNGTYTQLAAVDAGIVAGGTYHLVARLQGSQVQIFVDGTLRIDIAEPFQPTGTWYGLHWHTSAPPRFDSFSIRTLDSAALVTGPLAQQHVFSSTSSAAPCRCRSRRSTWPLVRRMARRACPLV